MVGYYYKTGAEIYSILRFMKNCLDLPYKPSAGSIEVVKMYADKKYRFSFFLNERKEIVYLIEQLDDDTTDYSKEDKPMNIYEYANSRPDYVSNPLTAINTMIMIGNLKERFGDKLHETARTGYLTMLDIIPCKYYKLYLWYWCDSCYYGIRECTEEDFNIKEEKKMTKEEALKKIKELKAFVEKLDEEIPEMPYDENSTNQIVVGRHMISFKSLDTRECYRIKAFELAHLMYAREHINHFGITDGPVWHLYFDTDYLDYRLIQPANVRRYSDFTNPWVFINRDDATKVANYMNKYVKDKVKELY